MLLGPINDKTFVLRLRNFLMNTEVSDLPGLEEKDYLLKMADKLLDYQIKTCTDESERKYLENNKIWTNNSNG